MRVAIGFLVAVFVSFAAGALWVRAALLPELTAAREQRMAVVESDVARIVRGAVGRLMPECNAGYALLGQYRTELDLERMRVVACAASLPKTGFQVWLASEERDAEALRHRGCGRCSVELARGDTFEMRSELSGCDWWTE